MDSLIMSGMFSFFYFLRQTAMSSIEDNPHSLSSTFDMIVTAILRYNSGEYG